MDSARWRRVKELFQRATAQPSSEREAYLRAQCAGDEDLLAEVQALLRADEEPGDVVAERVRSAAEAATQEHFTDQRIGPYRIDRVLGRGGMGAVYLAHREDGGFEQEVAIKVVAAGLATGSRQIDRFRAERQILAQLNHKHIARLLDGGETEQGLPYLVMEYVNGVAVDRWCREQGLEVADRLRLFIDVCEAVNYAHQNLVVHRDLKPANILVEDQGVPKLLDFGIAKLLASDPLQLDATGTLNQAMTVDFATPEQVRGKAVTTRTDVYALGLLLYVMLTDERPYRFSESSLREVERVVCELELTKPSQALTESQSHEQPEGRPISAGQLKGDLDNIVLKALRKEPEHRYSGVTELVADIQRFLNGHPVSARSATFGYRARKFYTRNRKAVLAAAAAILALSALSVLYVRGISSERDRAQLEALKAEQVAGFLGSLFAESAPGEALGEDVRASDLLDRGAQRIEEELTSQPHVQAEMMELIGKISREIGNFERSLSLLERALSLRKELLGDRHLDTTNTMHQLATTLHETGALDRSEELFRDTLQIRREILEPSHPKIIASLNALGDLVHTRGDLEEAEDLYGQVLAMVDALPEEQRTDFAGAYNNMGRVLHDRGRLEEAEAYLRHSLDLRKQKFGELHPEVDTALSNLAVLLRDRAQYEEAEQLYVESLSAARQLYGDDHPHVGVRLNNLASLFKALGRTDEAIDLQRQALEIFQQKFGDDHQRVAMSYNNLANLLHDRGDAAEALLLHRKTLELNQKLYGDEHHLVAGTFANLAVLLMEMGNAEQAEPMMRRALALDRKMLGDDHAFVAGDLDTLAEIAIGRGAYDQAETLIEESLSIKAKALTESHPGYATSLAIKGRMLTETGRAEQAEPLLRQAMEIHSSSLPEGHLNIQSTKAELGLCLYELEASQEATNLLIEAESALRAGGFRHLADADRAKKALEK